MHWVNTQLPHAGIRFSSLDFPGKSICQLLDSGIVSEELLAMAGFSVIDDYQPYSDLEDYESYVGNVGQKFPTQFLHKDNYGRPDLITLRYSGSDKPRAADTVIASDTDALFRRVIDYLHKTDSLTALQHVINTAVATDFIEQLRNDYSALGIDKVGSAVPLLQATGIHEDGPWRRQLFLYGGCLSGHTALAGLYDVLEAEGFLHRHRWQKNQVLIIDNKRMAHARQNRADIRECDADHELMKRMILQWEEGCVSSA